MISCGADKSIYFRTAQKVRPLGVPDRAGVGMGFQVTRGEERQSKLCDLVMHLVVCPRAPYCSLEKEYSLLGRTTWYGRQPSMTWMWSLAGSTRPSAAKTEIFGGHSLLRLFKNAFFIYFVWGGREGMCMYHGEHVDIRGLWRSNFSHQAWQQVALLSGSFCWPPLLRRLDHILSCSSVPTWAFLSRLLSVFEATKYFALPERVDLGWGEGSPRAHGE